MDLTKRYKDVDDNEKNILQMVNSEPLWAANMIQYYENQLAKAKQFLTDALPHIECKNDSQNALITCIGNFLNQKNK